jgi:hypothetical protein
VFTNEVLPLMKETSKEEGSDVRIVNVCAQFFRFSLPANLTKVSSMGHEQVSPKSFATKEDFNKQYGTSFTGHLNTYGMYFPSLRQM